MKTKLRNLIIIVSGVSLLFGLDFVRDYFFKNIQFQSFYTSHLDSAGNHSVENYTDSLIEPFLTNLDLNNLYYLKWGGTLFFIILFACLGALLNYLIYKDKKVVFYLFGLYAIMTIFSVLIFFSMYLFTDYEQMNKMYLTSLQIAHFLQSSLPALLFLVSFKLYKDNY